GAPETAEAAFKPIREFRPPAIDFAGPIPFPMLQGMFDALYPAGLQWYWRGGIFLRGSSQKTCLPTHKDDAHPTTPTSTHIPARNPPPCTRPCTSPPSTGRRAELGCRRQPGDIAMPTLPRSLSVLTPIRKTMSV